MNNVSTFLFQAKSMDTENILDYDIEPENEQQIPYEIIHPAKFILLSTITVGLYELWWMYKTWNFFKEKDKMDILPAARAIFSILFFYPLMEKIKEFAVTQNIQKNYLTILLFLGYVISGFSDRLPDPFWLLTFISPVFFIPPIFTFNETLQAHPDFNAVEYPHFNNRQWILIGISLLLWGLAITSYNV